MTNNALPVSVVMVSFKTGKLLLSAVETVLNTNVAEFVFVNNGNLEVEFSSIRKMLLEDSRCKLIEGQGNVGYGSAINLGVSHVRNTTILLLNPDISAGCRVIDNFIAEHFKLAPFSISGAWVVDESGDVQRGTLRNLLTPLSLFIEALRLQHCFETFNRWGLNRTDLTCDNELKQVTAINGACILMSTKTFRDAGGFDERFFLHFEDLDLFKRLSENPIYLHRDVVLTHAKSSSDIKKSKLNTLKYRAFCLYFKKHYPFFWFSPLGIVIKIVFAIFRNKLFSR